MLYYGIFAIWLVTTAMHIPDGYLSPVTSHHHVPHRPAILGHRRQEAAREDDRQECPLDRPDRGLFVRDHDVQRADPGGTTAHAVGGALAAIILGPEIATMAVSIALVIQAFFFGDGGILALGANCFNMAVVLPYVSYAIYQAHLEKPAGHLQTAHRRGCALGGWAGLTVAAFFAGVEFGIQPLFFHTANGTPLYAPYPLSVSIPAMVIAHALIASAVEALVTALVVAYLQRANQPALEFRQEARNFA